MSTEEQVIFDEAHNPKRKEKKKNSASSKYYNLPEDELQKLIAEAQKEIFTGKIPRVKEALRSNSDIEEIKKRFSITDEQLDEIQKITRPLRTKTIAQEELLKIFDNFLSKYVALLYKGKYDLHDYDIRRLIGLFVTHPDTKMRLRYNKITVKTYMEVNEVMRGINMMVTRYNDIEEVRSTVEMSFLACIDKYKRKGEIPFSGFIYNYMFFILQKNIKLFLIDQLGRKSFPLYTDDDVSSSSVPEGMDNPPQTIVPETPSMEDLLGPENIDENWVVEGGTAMWPFDQLTPHQRQLLKWRYIDGLKASKIALKTTEHPNTCRAKFSEIKTKIDQILREELTI